jgi:predicted MFS family arabinose efflux permease
VRSDEITGENLLEHDTPLLAADASREPGRGIILAALCTGAFVFPLAAFIVGPLLVDLSRAFEVSVVQAGQLVTLAAVPSALLALIIGPLSDLYGRRPVLLLGNVVLGLSIIGSALAPTYELMAVTRIVTGVGAAMVGPTTFAAVADLFAYHERGKAYGILLAAMNISTIIGTPATTLIAEQWGWRWAFAMVGVIIMGAVVALLWLYPKSPRATDIRLSSAIVQAYLPVLRTRSALAVLASTLAMSIGWMAFQTYLGAFFIFRYDMSTGGLAPILATGGVGILIGSQIGGRVGDRVGHKPITLWAIGAATGFIVLQLLTTTNLLTAAAINFVMSIPMGMRFTSMSVVISEAVPTARGTMNALNSTFFNIGILLAASVGGLVVDSIGFEGLAVLVIVGHLASIVVLGLFLEEHSSQEP